MQPSNRAHFVGPFEDFGFDFAFDDQDGILVAVELCEKKSVGLCLCGV